VIHSITSQWVNEWRNEWNKQHFKRIITSNIEKYYHILNKNHKKYIKLEFFLPHEHIFFSVFLTTHTHTFFCFSEFSVFIKIRREEEKVCKFQIKLKLNKWNFIWGDFSMQIFDEVFQRFCRFSGKKKF
jgi:hypothetical protein